MKKKEWNEGLDHLDADIIENYIEQKEKLARRKASGGIWLRFGALAACIVLIVSTLFAVPMLWQNAPDPVIPSGDSDTSEGGAPESEGEGLPPAVKDEPTIFEPIIYSGQQLGSSLEFVEGSSVSVSGGGVADEPPAFDFDVGYFAVKARVVKNHSDIYYKLDVRSEYKPEEYRLIQMEAVEVICGENVPQYFLYLLPSYLYVDMSAYDSLIISMTQLGTEGYVLRNATKNQMEAFEIPIFSDIENLPQLGNVIAFSDGVFDESLWQNGSWRYGYQFGRYYLDNPEYGDLVVCRGDTEGEVIAEIESRLSEWKEHLGERYKAPKVLALNVKSQAAREAIEYVKPFENGVFSQEYYSWGGSKLIFKRFINGCQTEETITIDLSTEEVTYSEVRYTAEDMAELTDISVYLSERAEEYKEQLPTPPHTDPEGKKLLSLNLYAWYVKVDGKLYGVIKTAWRYQEEGDYFIQYYDDAYVLYDVATDTVADISRDDLIELVGTRNVYTGIYGEGIEIPM